MNKIKWIKYDVYYKDWTFQREKGTRNYCLPPHYMSWLTDKLGDLLTERAECLTWFENGTIICVEYTIN